MTVARFLLLLLIVAVAVALPVPLPQAVAQVPPHQPGSICFTPNLWCWMQEAGPVGAPCRCYTPQTGWVNGTLG